MLIIFDLTERSPDHALFVMGIYNNVYEILSVGTSIGYFMGK